MKLSLNSMTLKERKKERKEKKERTMKLSFGFNDIERKKERKKEL